MALLLSVFCAVSYGVADYAGGRSSRRLASTVVTLVGQFVSLLLVSTAVAIIGTRLAPGADLAWGAGGGAVGGLALVMFYRALSRGAMTVVAPTTAVVSAVLPVVVGFAQGERPTAVATIGVVAACIAVPLVSGAVGARGQHASGSTITLAVAAGIGFGFVFVALSHTSDASGLWPLVGARAASVPLVAAVVASTRPAFTAPRRVWLLVVASGVLDMLANLFFLLASRRGLLVVVSVVSSLYPVSTVCLAYGLDGERVRRSQGVGLGVAAAALVLVGVG